MLRFMLFFLTTLCMVTVVLEIWVLTHLQEHERARKRNRVRGTKIKIERERREREIGRVRGTKMEN